MQPFQSASEELNRQGELPVNYGKKALGAITSVAGLASGGIALSKVIPLLNKYVPEDLAIKGLNKINPGFGKFINKAMEAGQSFDEIKSFIQEKAEEGNGISEKKESRNIIQKYSPELYSFMDQEVRSGRSPMQAGAIAQNDKRFANIINKMSKENKLNWSSIIESVFNGNKSHEMNKSMKTDEDQSIMDLIRSPNDANKSVSGTERLIQLLQQRKNK